MLDASTSTSIMKHFEPEVGEQQKKKLTHASLHSIEFWIILHAQPSHSIHDNIHNLFYINRFYTLYCISSASIAPPSQEAAAALTNHTRKQKHTAILMRIIK